MNLLPGTRLGSYEVVGPLGAGAMGAVYRAIDPRLGRSVAIKVVSERALLFPSALARFEQEARAASTIAHPNIVTVHEIGEVDGVPYIVMELVEGKSLRRILADGTPPLKTLLDLSVQMADGLAAAHSRGLVHRDLKPENVMVTPSGVVKILDFGLARPFTAPGSPADSTLTSPVKMTDPGIIVGTVSYMSPEQARGTEVDFRSDQFSFGAVLYEMVTGRVAFKRDSGAETLTAIIREDPVPLRDLAPASPLPLRWIVERCLAREREHRYDSTQDLARELRTLRDHASEISSGVSVPGIRTGSERRATPRAWAAATALLAVIAAAAIGLAITWRAPKPLPTFRRLTFQRGHVTGARFAPDGQTVIYSAAWEGKPSEIFSTHLSTSGSRPLGISEAWLCGINGTGDIAFRICKNYDDLATYFTGTLALAPLGGGTPRQIRKLVASADIARGGTDLAVAAVDLRTAGRVDLEYPLGRKLATGTFLSPRISPDGSLLVAVQDVGESEGLAIVTFDRGGTRRVLSKGRGLALSPVWSPRGDEVWFSAGDAFPQTVLAVNLRGGVRELLRTPPTVLLEDVSRDGRVLLRHQESRRGIRFRPSRDAAERDLTWLVQSELADLSRDGTLILFTDRGSGPSVVAGTYVRATDGSPATRLGEGRAEALSPDAKWALSRRTDEPTRLHLLPIGPQEARTLELPVRYDSFVGWSSDGDRIFFLGVDENRSQNLYELTISSGKSRRIGPKNLFLALLSPDEKTIAGCEETPERFALFSLDGGPARPIPGWTPGLFPLAWDPDGRSLFVIGYRDTGRILRLRLEDGRVEPWAEIRPEESVSISVGGHSKISAVIVSPATGAFAYSYERVLSELYLVEGLK
ncbi:MAG TPA: protein kinase [Thermoanaerobaculia bacterium]|nr:protein kinase [Thermoanaerobaculia bacterium]HQR66159.1 protein kinase [Thermoanaerobaculia bacterium]